MQAAVAMQSEMPAVEARERLVEFVAVMAADLAHGRQRENALVYLPEDWCEDLSRRRKAKIPDELVFQTKPQFASALCEQAAGWEIARAPVLADCAYGENRQFRTGLHEAGLEYVLAVSAQIAVFG